MRFSRVALATIALLGLLSPLSAGTPCLAFEPGTDDARAGLCDAFAGVAFTFCVAFCEARECDRQPPGDERCILLRRGFDRVTGGVTPPCVDGGSRRRDAAGHTRSSRISSIAGGPRAHAAILTR